ncbi:hypothetical protein EYZ11_008129 [Aspergillus tanneri]|uniref:Uncharacterized protein n=1 Tax=Aspergillus tanneri TaxID=1220188 RepID=A0A4S3JB95_9EURO|nr:hypothetical protein EYZ11_008129 [Aspergillus tanneri]
MAASVSEITTMAPCWSLSSTFAFMNFTILSTFECSHGFTITVVTAPFRRQVTHTGKVRRFMPDVTGLETRSVEQYGGIIYWNLYCQFNLKLLL